MDMKKTTNLEFEVTREVNTMKKLKEILYIIFDYSHKHYTFKQFEV